MKIIKFSGSQYKKKLLDKKFKEEQVTVTLKLNTFFKKKMDFWYVKECIFYTNINNYVNYYINNYNLTLKVLFW